MMEQLTNGEILTEEGNGRVSSSRSQNFANRPSHPRAFKLARFLLALTAADYCFRHASAYIRPRISRGIKTPISLTLLTLVTSDELLEGERGEEGDEVVPRYGQQQQQQPRPTRKRETETGSGRPTAGFSKRIARVVGARREGFQLTAHIQPSFEYNNIARGCLASVRRRIRERRIVGGGSWNEQWGEAFPS